MITRFLPALFVAALFFVPVASVSHAASADEAGKYVEKVAGSALSIISNKSYKKEQKQLALEKLFADSVDIAWVGRFVVGRFWRTASDDQKKRYLKEYEHFLLSNYTSRFSEYSSGSYKIMNIREDSSQEFTVSMQLLSGDKNAEPVLVDYRLRRQAGSFRIFDVIVEGVSLITTQRSEFASVLSDKGMDYLIGQLASKSLTIKN